MTLFVRRRFLAQGAGIWRGLFAVALLGVLLLSLMPASVSLPTTGWDKSNHLLAFSVLALLGNWAWSSRTVPVLLGLLGYGGLIEVLQSFTPDRSAEWDDLLADGVGLVAGEAMARLVWRYLPHQV